MCASFSGPTKLAPCEAYLRARQEAAKPLWIPATVLLREIAERGYRGGQTQLRAFVRTLKPAQALEPLVRFETTPGEQLQVDWVEFRKGANPLHAFCATLGFSRASYVEFVADMKVQMLVACHERAFEAFGGVPRRVLYDLHVDRRARARQPRRRSASLPRRVSRLRQLLAASSSSCVGRTVPRQKERSSASMAT